MTYFYKYNGFRDFKNKKKILDKQKTFNFY